MAFRLDLCIIFGTLVVSFLGMIIGAAVDNNSVCRSVVENQRLVLMSGLCRRV